MTIAAAVTRRRPMAEGRDRPSPVGEADPPNQDLVRMAMLGELLGTTTHEFNNVLMTIINYAKLGMRNTEPATRQGAFEKILAAGERAAKITATILAVARNRATPFESVDLPALVEDMLVLLERELKRYRITTDFRRDPVPPVRARASQVQQVVLNLLVNARQAMPDGGTLRIRFRFDPDSQMVELWIRDSGTGIPREQLPRIFEPYYSTKDGPDETGRGGTGLGLSTCREIIQAHGGRIRVESSLGKGTAFSIRLPQFSSNT